MRHVRERPGDLTWARTGFHPFDGAATIEFPLPDAKLNDALSYCDMTTVRTGDIVSVQHRLSEIVERYGPGDVATRFIHRAEPELVSSVRRTGRRMRIACKSTSGH